MFRKTSILRPTEEGQINSQKADQLTHQVNKSAQLEQEKTPVHQSETSLSGVLRAHEATCE